MKSDNSQYEKMWMLEVKYNNDDRPRDHQEFEDLDEAVRFVYSEYLRDTEPEKFRINAFASVRRGKLVSLIFDHEAGDVGYLRDDVFEVNLIRQ